ncbi:hypothetical protein ABFX02_12G092800 [Erythranthe guttata]
MSAVITQWRNNNSGEIDVFEAARYFSGGAGQNPINTAVPPPPPQRALACRISLEMPKNPYSNLSAAAAAAMDHGGDQKKQEKKKYKQPSSPGGKLASFLNSLFNQTTSKNTTTKKLMKKKNTSVKSGSSNNDLEEERKRRSSISHFKITTTSDSSNKSTYANMMATPTKSSLRSLSHHQIELGVSAPSRIINAGVDQKRTISDNNIISYRNNNAGFGFSDRSSTVMNRKFSDDDDDDEDGAESDSSSDLFDLPNHDLDFCSASSGNLPVYGTTHMDRIRISAPISAVATFL